MRTRSFYRFALSEILLCLLLLQFTSGIFSSRFVTLDSIQIFKTHEWLPGYPTIYFRCHGENMTVLPDVKKKFVLYTFKGEESWQPLTELPDKKCKRCGLYERDSIKSDDIFDEWELCPGDFAAPKGTYAHFKGGEFNATFLCPQCIPLEVGLAGASGSENGDAGNRRNLILEITIGVLASGVSVIGAVAAYRYWQRKKREQDQARFLKLFEDGEGIEDELGLGHEI